MSINFTGHDIEVTPALQSLIEKKFERVRRHFTQPITSINVILGSQKLTKIAEITVHIKGSEINARASADDMYKAIDLMLDKLNRQLMKYKTKHTEHKG